VESEGKFKYGSMAQGRKGSTVRKESSTAQGRKGSTVRKKSSTAQRFVPDGTSAFVPLRPCAFVPFYLQQYPVSQLL